jgi:hypothetical protein
MNNQHIHTAWSIKDGIVIDRVDIKCSCSFGKDHVNSTQGAVFMNNQPTTYEEKRDTIKTPTNDDYIRSQIVEQTDPDMFIDLLCYKNHLYGQFKQRIDSISNRVLFEEWLGRYVAERVQEAQIAAYEDIRTKSGNGNLIRLYAGSRIDQLEKGNK